MSICTSLEPGDWTALYEFGNADKIAFARLPKTNILSVPLLDMAVGKTRANRVLRSIKVLPEINREGERHCVFIHNDKRCDKYNKDGVLCGGHVKDLGGYGKFFKSTSLRQIYDRHYSSGHKLSLDGELALQRTMLSLIVEKCQGETIPMDMIIPATALAEKISQIVEKISKMNAITPEHVEHMLNGVVEIMAKYLPPEQLMHASQEVLALQNITASPINDAQFEPGVTIEANGEVLKIEANDGNSMLRRALEDTASRMGVTTI